LEEKTKDLDGRSVTGKEFDEIVKYFPKRTAGACHAYYNSHFKREGPEKRAHPYAWTKDEIDLLKVKTKRFYGGFIPATELDGIAVHFPFRTTTACKVYYTSNLMYEEAESSAEEEEEAVEEEEVLDDTATATSATAAVSRPAALVLLSAACFVDTAEEEM
jgi:hypothetical protein